MPLKNIAKACVAGLAFAFLAAFAAAGCGESGDEQTTQSPDVKQKNGESFSTGYAGAEGNEDEGGGEKSIEEFGSEAEGSEEEEILGSFTAYLEALADDDLAVACSYLASNVQQSLAQLAGGKLKRNGCPAILSKLLAPTANAVAREQVEGEITKVRVQGDRAFVVFHAPGAKLFQMTMVRENGDWKVAIVAASVLVPDL